MPHLVKNQTVVQIETWIVSAELQDRYGWRGASLMADLVVEPAMTGNEGEKCCKSPSPK